MTFLPARPVALALWRHTNTVNDDHTMGRCNNRRVQQAAQASRNTPSRARFSKPLPSKKKAGRGKGRGDKGANGGGRGGGRQAHASVIDKLSKRVESRQVTAAKRSRRGPLSGVDVSRLDEITLSGESIQLITRLLTDLNVIMESTEPNDEATEDDTAGDQVIVENYEDSEDDIDDDAIFDEQIHFAGKCGYFEYEDDVEEDVEPTRAITDVIDDEPCDGDDDDESEKDSDDRVRQSPLFVHLTTQLSFSEAHVERACLAIENWHIHEASDALDSDQLALAMDWLCLHLTDE